MADFEKLQRLKAARKKVKEHKLKKEIHNPKDETPVLFNAESMTSSLQSNDGSLPDNQTNKNEELPLTNYFVPQQPSSITVDPIAFFDSLPTTNSIFATSNQPDLTSENILNEEESIYVEESNLPATNNMQKEVSPTNNFSSIVNEENPEVVRDFQAYDTITYENAESLRQLSSQMTQLVNMDTADFNATNITNDLERRNQELANLLSNEKIKYEQLSADLEVYKTKLTKLEEESRIERDELERKISMELNPLREQLETHMQTVGILVGEKSELSATLSQCQLMLKQKTNENEELNGRLKTSRSRVADLEKELTIFRQERNQYDKMDVAQSEKLKEYDYLKKQKEELDLDTEELRKKLEVSHNENAKLAKDTQELRAQLSLADIKIQQLTAGESANALSQIETLTQEKLLLEKHLSESKQIVKSITHDREQASIQYQQYVQQLNGQLNSLAQRLESVTSDNENLSKREQDLVKHISELEKRLQNLQNEHLKSSLSNNNDNLGNIVETFENLKLEKSKIEENLNDVRNERDELLKELLQKKNIIEELEGTIERLRVDQPDNAKLLATIESDKVAAARAVLQNQQLKEQLEEMQNAFIKMSNDKMDLTETLESERHKIRELSEKLQTTESNLHKLTEAIEIKDRELTQIRDGTNDGDKHILQIKQLEDRLRHYEAQENSYHVLEKELKEVLQQVNALSLENEQLKVSADVPHLEEFVNHSEVNGTSNIENNETERSNEEVNDSVVNVHKQNTAIVNMLNKDIAMKRLEEKFTKTMEDVANLQDEKQSLEHLVLQLQGETETIGEYIMLYQHQRAVLKQRAVEKEEQLKRLSSDREEMRQKLEKLNKLIGKLMSEQNGVPIEILDRHRSMEKENICIEHANIKNDANREVDGTNGIIGDGNDNKRETATEIIALLSEIKTSNLVQSDDNFHPCPWCSGKLITI